VAFVALVFFFYLAPWITTCCYLGISMHVPTSGVYVT
jgi:hypothetical protein